MRFVTFEQGAAPARAGVLADASHVFDLAHLGSGFPSTVQQAIEGGAELRAKIEAAIAKADKKAAIPLSSVKLLAPLPKPLRNILCVGRNYVDHVKEVQAGLPEPPKEALPEFPVIFTKAPSCVIGPGATVPGHLDYSNTLDYEGELAVVIGAPGRGISKADAMKHVFGYTIFNDVTARKLQRQHNQWFLGKSVDGFGPMGPAIVTADEIADVTKLRVRTTINGELRQDEAVSSMIFDIPTVIETISRTMRLESGDVIATGTPAGVGLGFKPPKFMSKGDEMVVSIDQLGELRNSVG
jgi:2-keto-4-pentenoate hydratase/2-oxohepta-3-ene-1,7-dioic acid hydratase in catechol pathway